MESFNPKEQSVTEGVLPPNRVHHVLAHSYFMYLVLFLVGVYLDFIFKIKIFSDYIMVPIGATLLVLSSILIFWAQKTTKNFKNGDLSKETFSRGPYRYIRNPTHWGLFLVVLSFGVIANGAFVILTTFISFIVSVLIFLEKQDKILEEKYGTHFTEYKKTVKF